MSIHDTMYYIKLLLNYVYAIFPY